MRVVTIDGGFRGLGDVSSRARMAAVADFTRRISVFDDTWERFSVFRQRGELSAADEATVTAAYARIVDRVNEHMAAADAISGEASLTFWRDQSAQILSAATAWVQRARFVMGEEATNRGLRIFLLAAASITVLGGGMYVFYRATKKPRRRRR